MKNFCLDKNPSFKFSIFLCMGLLDALPGLCKLKQYKDEYLLV